MSEEVQTSDSTPEQLPVTRCSKLHGAVQEYVSEGETAAPGELVAYYVGVAVLIHPESGEPRYQVFHTESLGTYKEAELVAVLEDHLSVRRSTSFR